MTGGLVVSVPQAVFLPIRHRAVGLAHVGRYVSPSPELAASFGPGAHWW
jgi:hypothetical protein